MSNLIRGCLPGIRNDWCYMPAAVLPYPEKRLQLAALAWAQEHMGYRPMADDAEATGDRMDAVGLIGDELLIIETKVDVHEAIVRFNPAMSGALEPKIGATLQALYAGERQGQPGIIGRHWDGRTPPTIGILAGTYSEAGLTALVNTLDERARDWRFSYRVWQWTGEEIAELACFMMATAAPCPNLSGLRFPPMISRSAKRGRQPGKSCVSEPPSAACQKRLMTSSTEPEATNCVSVAGL